MFPMLPFEAIDNVRRQRQQYELEGDPRRPSISAPLPDMAWDAFFGAMKGARDDAFASGNKFRANFNPQDAMSGLRRAMRS